MSEYELVPLLRPVEAARGALNDPALLTVAVVGRFKAGKSSFLNHLIGRPLLPADVLPATAVVTHLRYGAADRALVRYLDGRCSPVKLDAVADFVTERLNPDNAKGVGAVELELDSLAPYEGLRLVDTPGLGSVFTHNTRTSMDWLPEVGVALVAMSVDPPLGEGDLRLLADVAAFTPELVVLLTKVTWSRGPSSSGWWDSYRTRSRSVWRVDRRCSPSPSFPATRRNAGGSATTSPVS